MTAVADWLSFVKEKETPDDRSHRKKRPASQPMSSSIPTKTRLLEKEPDSLLASSHDVIGTLSSGLFDFDEGMPPRPSGSGMSEEEVTSKLGL